MIITFIFVVMVLLSIIFTVIGEKHDKHDFLEPLGVIGWFIGGICLIVSILMIIVAQSTATNTIQRNKIEYEGLLKRYEIIKSEYEDVSKSDVIADITAWNIDVYNTKYWTSSPWTNWFNPREVADNMNYISLEE